MKKKLKFLPAKPGVYLFKNSRGRVIYVGKAVNLRSRVASYFRESGHEGEKTARLARSIHDLDFIITANELEALLLESTLIKKHKPHYNVRLKDDTGYPYMKLTNEQYPRLEVARRVNSDGARYFGPYSSAAGVRGTLRFLHRVFPLRNCKKMRKEPCMYFHIDKCSGPCSGDVSPEEYRKTIKEVTMFLEGRTGDVIRKLKNEMKHASAEMNFEKAAILRDRVAALESVTKERQTIMFQDGRDRDVIAVVNDGRLACAEIMFIRKGLLTGHDPFILNINDEQSPEETMAAFIKLYYGQSDSPPAELFLSHEPDEKALLTEMLESKTDRRVHLRTPQRGQKKKLVDTALENARQRLDDEISRQNASRETRRKLTQALTQRIGAQKLIRRIVGFDISTIQGSNTVGAAIVFQDAKPDKNSYRKFIIRGTGRDDFSSMREMTARYFARVRRGEEEAPDLVVVDGGRGQVTALAGGLAESGYSGDLFAIGYAKKSGVSHVLGESTPIVFDPAEDAARLVQMVIGEVHRFAITFHRKKRSRTMIES